MLISATNIIKNSFELAKKRGLKFKFEKKNLGEKYHPNGILSGLPLLFLSFPIFLPDPLSVQRIFCHN